MFGYYPRAQPTYSPYYQSPYARAQQQRARAYELERQREIERQRALQAQEIERRRRAAQYFPDGYDEDDVEYYLTPQQRALLEARRRHEALEQRRFEAARQAQAEAIQRQQRAREPSPPATRRSPSPAPEPEPTARTQEPSVEELAAAATKIQTAYRVYRALRSISALSSDFTQLKFSFTTPTTIDYLSDGRTISVPVPNTLPEDSSSSSSAKLAYTPTNVPLHTYTEYLSRLLVKLDAVDSHGDRRVRDARRTVVRVVEAEASRIESFWRRVWDAHTQSSEEEEVSAMVVDAPTPAPALTPDAESESDVEPEFATPAGTPISRPAVLPAEGVEEEGVVVEPEDEEKEYVIVQ